MIQYNKSIVAEFKNSGKTVSSVDEFIIGEIYFSNGSSNSEEFILRELISDKEHWRRFAPDLFNEETDDHDDVEICWFVGEAKDGTTFMDSLYDRNIGRSYNPWMIFKTKEALNEYNKVQVITYESHWSDALDWGYSDYYDEEVY